MQESVTLWEGYGGAIRPDKSHWYLNDFVLVAMVVLSVHVQFSYFDRPQS